MAVIIQKNYQKVSHFTLSSSFGDIVMKKKGSKVSECYLFRKGKAMPSNEVQTSEALPWQHLRYQLTQEIVMGFNFLVCLPMAMPNKNEKRKI